MDTTVDLKWNDGRVKAVAKAAAQEALMTLGLAIQREAQEIVPHDEGHLEGSAVTEPLGSGQVGVRVAFGGPATAYAVRQHEDTSIQHTNGRQAKYLETPFKANVDKAPRLVELAVKAALKGGK